MSQRTRSRTTGDNPTTPSAADAGADTPTPPAVRRKTGRPASATSAAPDASPPRAVPLNADNIARALRVVAEELERDPDLARRVAGAISADAAAPQSVAASEPSGAEADDEATPEVVRVRPFRPRVITGADPRLGTGIPDPFALRERLGEDGLRAALADLRLGTLRAIAREHGLDPKGTASRQNDEEKLRHLILTATVPAASKRAAKAKKKPS